MTNFTDIMLRKHIFKKRKENPDTKGYLSHNSIHHKFFKNPNV